MNFASSSSIPSSYSSSASSSIPSLSFSYLQTESDYSFSTQSFSTSMAEESSVSIISAFSNTSLSTSHAPLSFSNILSATASSSSSSSLIPSLAEIARGDGVNIGANTNSNSFSSSSSSMSFSSSSSFSSSLQHGKCQATNENDSDSEDSSSLFGLSSNPLVSPPSIDQAFIKVPYESVMRTFRNLQKQVEKDVTVISSFIEKKLPLLFSDGINQPENIKKMDKLIEKLEALKEKINDGCTESEMYLKRCQKRLKKLSAEADIQDGHTKGTFSYEAYQERIAWIVYEYLERRGLSATAEALKKQENVDDYVDSEIHKSMHEVIRGLKNRDTKCALEWCTAHRFKLKKIGSFFEAELHLQNAIEFLLQNKAQDAIDYIKRNISAEDFENCPDVKKVMTVPAFLNDPPPSYSYLLGQERWKILIRRFQENCAEVYCFPARTSIEILLQAGFSAIKSQVCGDHKSASCPACQPELANYLSQIPTPHRARSCLICSISGEVMDDENPPLVSPNGHVYSHEALKALAVASNGYVECPRTKEKFAFSQFQKIFVT